MRNGRGIIFLNTIGRFSGLAVLLVVLFCGRGWSACTSVNYVITEGVSPYGVDCCSSDWPNASSFLCKDASCSPIVSSGGSYFSDVSIARNSYCTDAFGCNCLTTGAVTCTYHVQCSSECEAEQYDCEHREGNWTWLGCEEGCVENTIDTTVCDTYREQCKTLGGVFEGTVLNDGCSAVCNTCGSNASQKILDVKKRSCCVQGLAPSIDEMCTTPLQSGVGMTVSSNANLECSDPNLSPEAMQSYVENCSDPDSTLSSSSVEPSSSGDGGSSGTDTSGLGRDYYPILDTIRDSLVDIRKNVETITMCLLSPNACAGLMNEGDTVIVNVSDSTYIKQLGTKLDGLNSTLDTSLQNSSERLGDNITHSISASTDSLIDSMRKYMGAYHGDIQEMDSANRAYLSDIQSLLSQIQRDSSGAGRIVGQLDSALGSGSGADTSGVSYNWLQHGEALGDSIVNGSGYGGLDFDGDSLLRDSLLNAGYSCNNDSCCIGSQCVYFDSDSLIEDSLTRYISRMGDSIDQKNTSYLKDSTTALFSEVQDSLKAFNPLGIFDSTMLNTLGAKIPNTNTCPEHCSRFQVDIPFFFGTRSYTIDFGLCLGRSVFADGNVLSFLRFIIRLIVAITCITAVMWNAARIRR